MPAARNAASHASLRAPSTPFWAITIVPDGPALEALGLRVLMDETVELKPLRSKEDCLPLPVRVGGAPSGRWRGIVPPTRSPFFCPFPAPYRQAAAAGFDLMLCGHTHGGQICLQSHSHHPPGARPRS